MTSHQERSAERLELMESVMLYGIISNWQYITVWISLCSYALYFIWERNVNKTTCKIKHISSLMVAKRETKKEWFVDVDVFVTRIIVVFRPYVCSVLATGLKRLTFRYTLKSNLQEYSFFCLAFYVQRRAMYNQGRVSSCQIDKFKIEEIHTFRKCYEVYMWLKSTHYVCLKLKWVCLI